MGVKIQFQILRAGGFNLNLSKADGQPHSSTYVIGRLSLLIASFGGLQNSPPTASSTTTAGFHNPGPDLNATACSHPCLSHPSAPADFGWNYRWQNTTRKSVIIFPHAAKAQDSGEFTRNSGKIYTPVHKPKPFKGIKIHFSWAAELTSVFLLLSNRILGVCTLAVLPLLFWETCFTSLCL